MQRTYILVAVCSLAAGLYVGLRFIPAVSGNDYSVSPAPSADYQQEEIRRLKQRLAQRELELQLCDEGFGHAKDEYEKLYEECRGFIANVPDDVDDDELSGHQP